MTDQLRVLHLEHVEVDSLRAREALEQAGLRCEVVRVASEAAFVQALEGQFDLILADYTLPALDGMKALELARGRCPQTPFLFVTAAFEDDTALETLRQGATDVIVKRRLDRLGPAAVRALREADQRAQLERAVRARDELLAIVSHDLRNPLATITAGASLLLEDLPKDRIHKLGHMLVRSARRMNRLIDDLLDLGRLDAGTLAIVLHPFDVGDVLRESLEAHAQLAAQKSLQLVATKIESSLAVNADRERVLQILSNLIGNAIRFTPEGGSVTLSAERVGETIQITTTDTGPGIPPVHAERVFDRFWRGHTEDKSGVGLGLSIVKGLVEANGGTVWLTSEPGRGATFTFTLPAIDVEVKPAPRPRPTVLVVDDDPSIRRALEKALTGASYRVVTAADGAEALERLRSEGAQLIILDLMMPRMDGFEFRARQSLDPRIATIPTLFITAYGKLREELTELPPTDAFIEKPFRMRELVSMVSRVVKPPDDPS